MELMMRDLVQDAEDNTNIVVFVTSASKNLTTYKDEVQT
jgi:hypothetical protein